MKKFYFGNATRLTLFVVFEQSIVNGKIHHTVYAYSQKPKNALKKVFVLEYDRIVDFTSDDGMETGSYCLVDNTGRNLKIGELQTSEDWLVVVNDFSSGGGN